MSISYVSVGWNPQKKWYDLTLTAGILSFLAIFIGAAMALHPNMTIETALIRGFGSGALVLLHIILATGPLCRINARFLPVLYNRRHMGVAMFFMGLAHAALAIIQFHAFSDMNPILSIFSNPSGSGDLLSIPFQPLGFLALSILFAMAATSHDFWLANLSAPVWKTLHMLVYLAYALLLGHVVLGLMQAETSRVIAAMTGLGCVVISSLHIVAGLRERKADRDMSGGRDWVEACGVEDIPEKRARIVSLSGERVAIFKYDGKISAVSNVCKHQNGPLGEGKVVDGCITCPWHGYQYNPNDGASPPPFTEKVPTFNIQLRSDRIWIDPKPNPPGTLVEPLLVATGDENPEDSFYVGYMPKGPTSIMKQTRLFVFASLGVAMGVALLFAVSMSPFPGSVFEFGVERQVQGYLRLNPHPHLLVERPAENEAWSAYYLVNPGKFGADKAVAPFADRWVSLKGTLIYRDDQTMVELAPGSIAELDQQPAAPELTQTQRETKKLVGEIVDSKCFFGVMNPGDLRVHKACAIRCIEGGIPPFLAIRLDDGNVHYYLLTGPKGRSINQDVLPFVAEPVEIEGTVYSQGSLTIMETEPEKIKRVDQ